MKKILSNIILISLIPCFLFPAYGFGKINYDLLYEDMPILDYMYETDFDPEESEDYEDYIISPYVLIRLPVNLRNKKTFLKRGYYLVKPEKKDGYRFVIFKQNGRIAGLIPVYKKYRVNPLEIYPEPEKPKHKWYVLPFVKLWDALKWPFKKLMEHRNPLKPPRAKVEFELVGEEKYYDMKLYIEDNMYKMLFKLEPGT